MDRLQKKCLVGSALFHGFLLLLVLFGSAFFVVKEKPQDFPRINVVPSRLVDDALAGGGGNPNLPRTDDQQKGQTLAPQPPPTPPPVEKVQPKSPQPAPAVKPPPTAKETPKPAIQKSPNPKSPDLTKVEPKPKETAKPETNSILAELKPLKRTTVDKEKSKREAEQREAARQAAEEARQARATQERFAKAVGQATASLQRGFSSGTKVEVGGPGGEAYASYSAFVRAAYDNAWKVQPDLADDNWVATAKVVVARDGSIIEARIIRRSANSPMDRSVQRALDEVKRLPAFPESSRDPQRAFEIEFNLKARRLLG